MFPHMVNGNLFLSKFLAVVLIVLVLLLVLEMVKIALLHITFLDVSFCHSLKAIPALTLNYRVFGTVSGARTDSLAEWESSPSLKDHPKWPERFRAEIEVLTLKIIRLIFSVILTT